MSDRTLIKAKSYLTEGKVLTLHANLRHAEFAVQGSKATPYTVTCRTSIWQCNCAAHVELCAHIQACKLIYKPVNTSTEIFTSDDDLFDELFKKVNQLHDEDLDEIFE